MKTPVKVAAIVVPLALVLVGIGSFFKIKADREWHRTHDPMSMPERMARLFRPTKTDDLARMLQKSGKVRSAEAFREEATQVGLKQARAGGYLLPHLASPRDLALIFKSDPPLRKVTFPEGYTVGQMATVLQKAGFTDALNLRQLAYPSADAPSPWEGRLFPDTYWLPRRASAKTLVGRLMGKWLVIANALPRPFPSIAGHPLTLMQVAILASLIEREAANDKERPIIASVLLNRLRQGMRLQCDASVLYGMRRAALAQGTPLPTVVTINDYTFASPYNTYKFAGLPIGAICNPGAASLRAAARPATTPYLFYVLSPKSGTHRFATTFAEHEHNIGLARLERGG